MKVLLKEDVESLGLAGDIKKVADGFGRNYLLPKGFAVIATPMALKQAQAWRSKAEARRAQIKAEFATLSAKVQAVSLTFTAKAGKNGKLYGSITTAEIAQALNDKLGTTIDRRKIGEEPLRQLGEHKIKVHLSGEHQPEFTVIIEPEGGVAAEEAQAPAAETA